MRDKRAPRGLQHLGFIPARLAPWFRWLLLWRRLSAPVLSLMSFGLLIVIGTAGLLWLPGLHAKEPLGALDALFTMTSAVCVTGLIVVDTATHFTFAGQTWIILFVQLGGLGIMTLSTLIIGALGRRLSLRSEMLTMMPMRHGDRPEVWEIALSVIKFSLIVEGIGAVVLFAFWAFEHPLDEALWHAVFHSISAYCNAGFSTYSDSLIGERNLVLIVFSILIIVGGVGYLAFEELVRWWRNSRARRSGLRLRMAGGHRLSSHTWAVVVMTVGLLLAGWLLYAIFEWSDTLGAFSLDGKLTNSWFMSVTARTAGFNTIDYGHVGNDTATLTLMLMFAGGSPGSTAGGVKTTTIAVIVALGVSRIRGLKYVGFKDRAIPVGTIERTIGIILLAMLVLTVTFFLVNAFQSIGLSADASRDVFLPIAFEVVSAFGTVGLSMNYTAELRGASEIVLIVVMFIGRVGLLSFFAAAILRRGHVAHVRPAQEDVMVG